MPEDILKGGYFLLDYTFQHLLFGPSNLLLVIVVNFYQPEFLESRLLLHFALEHPKLWYNPQRGEYTFSFILDLCLRGQFVRFRTLLDSPALGLRVFREGLLLRDIFFGDQRFHDDKILYLFEFDKPPSIYNHRIIKSTEPTQQPGKSFLNFYHIIIVVMGRPGKKLKPPSSEE